MATLLDCPSCRRKLRVPDDFLGKSVRCPSCAETFRAPETAPAPTPAESAPAPDPAPPLTVPLKLELDDEPPAPRPAAAPAPKESSPERRRERERYDDEDDEDDDQDRRRRRRRDFEPCPRCGDDIRRGAVVCPYCGLDLEEQGDGFTRRRRVRMDAEPHRAGTVQALGIASLVLGAFYFFPIGLPLGLAAWLMGRSDLKKMEDGVMDPNGRKKTKDGWLCGLVGTCLNTFWGLGLVAIITIALVSAASSTGPPLRPVAPPPAVKPGWAPPPQPAGRPGIDRFTLTWLRARPVVVKRGDEDGKVVFVDVDRAPGFVGRVTVTVQQPLAAGLRVDPPVTEKENGVERAHFTIWADEDARPGNQVLRLVGRSDDGREVILDLPVKVEP